MDLNTITQSPLSALTFVAAPALLTNASSVLALGTINRMLRTREHMHELFLESKVADQSADERIRLLQITDRVEKQAGFLLTALHAIYFALASFASATLVTLLGAVITIVSDGIWVQAMAVLGLVLGFFGAGGLVMACVSLFRTTQLSLVNIRDEAIVIRRRSSAA
jgi:hypothetical protein